MKTIKEILQELDVPALSSGAPQRIFKEIALIIDRIEQRVADLERKQPNRKAIEELED